MIWLLWTAAAVVGLKMNMDGLIGWISVFMAFMRVYRNQGGVPVEVLTVIEGFLVGELRIY